MSGEGQEELELLRQGGAPQSTIDAYEAEQRQLLFQGGVTQEQADAHFGKPPLTTKPIEEHFQQTISQAATEARGDGTTAPKPFTVEDAVEAGWQNSIAGLLSRKKVPDVIDSGTANWYQKLAESTTEGILDLPFYGAGGFLGAGGGAPSGPGAIVTAGAGAFAFPTALRGVLMDAYGKNEVGSASEFLQRAGGIMLDTAKAYVKGGSMAAGGLGGKAIAGSLELGATATSFADATGAIAAVTGVTSAMEGHLPEPQDVADAALAVVAFKTVPYVAGKLRSTVSEQLPRIQEKVRNIYAATGKRPEEVVQDARIDPTIQQDMLSINKPLPDAYRAAAEQQKSPAPEVKAVAEDVIPPEQKTDLDAARDSILSKIEFNPANPKSPYTFDKAYTDWVDSTHPLESVTKEMAGGKDIAPSDNPHTLLRLNAGTFGRVDHFIKHGTFDFDTYANTGKSLQDVLSPVKNDLKDFSAYLVAKRAPGLQARGLQSGFDVNEANTVIKGDKSRFEKTAQEFYAFKDRVLDYATKSGVVSKDAVDAMRAADAAHVPYYRVMDEQAQGNGSGGSPFKQFKGSDRNVYDPIETTIRNTAAIMAAADKNSVGQAYVRLAGKTSEPDTFAEKVTPPVRGYTATDKEMQKFLQSEGIDQVPEGAMTLFRANRQPLADNEIAVYNNGKREVYKLPDGVADVIKNTNKEAAGALVQLMGKFNETFKAGVTLSPDFLPKNLMRDQFMATLTSKNGYMLGVDGVRGMAEVLGQGEAYQRWLKSGGANATFLSFDQRYIGNELFNIKNEYGVLGKAWNVVSNPVQSLAFAGQVAENATRVGDFRKSPGGLLANPSKDDLLKAGFESRELTQDFARKGAKMTAYNMISAFPAAQIGGIDRLARAAKENPAHFAAVTAATIMVPSLLTWYANKDDQKYKEDGWERDNFWKFDMGDVHVRLPKPQDSGMLFGSGLERFLDYAYEQDPVGVKHYVGDVVSSFMPNVIPQFAVPMAEQYTGKNLWTGGPILPAGAEGSVPSFQYTPYTSETAKALGRLIGSVPYIGSTGFASPIILDNYIRQWTGGLGQYAIKLSDIPINAAEGLANGKHMSDAVDATTGYFSDLKNIPVIGAFISRYPSANSQVIQDFYDNVTRMNQPLNTLKRLQRNGDPQAKVYGAEIENTPMVKLQGIQGALAVQHRLILNIQNNSDIKPIEKRQQIEAIYYQMIDAARQGNERVKEADEQFAK